MTLQAITLWQPWGSLMALGQKTIETRSWSTPYRGDLAIHSGMATEGDGMCQLEPFKSVLERAGLLNDLGQPVMPRGLDDRPTAATAEPRPVPGRARFVDRAI